METIWSLLFCVNYRKILHVWQSKKINSFSFVWHGSSRMDSWRMKLVWHSKKLLNTLWCIFNLIYRIYTFIQIKRFQLSIQCIKRIKKNITSKRNMNITKQTIDYQLYDANKIYNWTICVCMCVAGGGGCWRCVSSLRVIFTINVKEMHSLSCL